MQRTSTGQRARTGNGGVDSPQNGVDAFRRYGVDGAMIARAALNKLWRRGGRQEQQAFL